MGTRVNTVDLFFGVAERVPDRTAIVSGKQRISFGELKREVLETAAYFQSKGIRPSDRVMVFVPMGLDLYRIVLALFDIGATVVFLDEWVSRERLEVCCKLAGCKAWVGGMKVHLIGLISSELRKMPLKLGTGYKIGAYYSKIETQASDPALITFTTGSTGVPKAAIRSHGQLLAQFDALVEKIAPDEGEIDMPVLPIVLLINLGCGCTSVIAPFKSKKPKKLRPEIMVELLQREKVNRIISSPFFAVKVAEYCAKNKIQLPHLNKVLTGGAPVFPNEAQTLTEGYPNARVEIVYGSTEAEPISSILASDLKTEHPEERNGLCVGQLHRKTKLKILPINDEPISVTSTAELEAMELTTGQIGEICVAGSHVLDAYLDNSEAVKRNKIFVDGVCWHRTGDSGFVGEDGRVFLTGRCNLIFEKNGRIVSPFIVENILQQMNEVNSGTILKIRDKITLFVKLNSANSEPTKLLESLKLEFPYCDAIVVLSELPKDKRHFSKIDYGKLIELYC